MNRILLFRPMLIWLSLLLVAAPLALNAQEGQVAPPVNVSTVREGDFAVDLEQALGVGSSRDEVEAETTLGNLGVAPRNGWIADYPVTPDILNELQQAAAGVADAGKLSIGRDEAMALVNGVAAKEGIASTAYNGPPPTGANPPPAGEGYPSPADIGDYYTEEGPPVVTYYGPPPDYYYLYAWVPYPFFCEGFWFPGFYILHDFHRVILFNGRPCFVSNHFNDVSVHRVFRVDPRARFSSRTYAGIGAPPGRSFISTGVPGESRAIFNAPRMTQGPGMPAPAFRSAAPPPTRRGGGRAFNAPGRRSAPRSAGPSFQGRPLAGSSSFHGGGSSFHGGGSSFHGGGSMGHGSGGGGHER
ncbi:MAG: hypothetical protein ABSD38_33050 [Syntrophorhabdales bacterium]